MNLELMNGISFVDYVTNEKYKVYINGAWIKITFNNTPVVVREPKQDNWYDEKHEALMKAKHAFEAALEDILVNS